MTEIEAGSANNPEALVRFGPSLPVNIGFDKEFDIDRILNISNDAFGALIDTGADHSCVDAGVAMSLRMPIINRRNVGGVHGVQEVNLHVGQIRIPALNFIFHGPIAGVNLRAGGIKQHVLLGRDILQQMNMVYDGRTGSVVISHGLKD